jgi:osmotically-inducible protein OsmY
MTLTLHTNDLDLKNAVTAELRWTPSIRSAQIGVSVIDGAVTLTGEVDTYPEKLMASQAAQRVHGVTAVAQEITISNTWREISDGDIAREAGESLQRNINVPVSVKAAVQKRVVTLSGEVEWEYQRDAAARAVHYLKGVSNVHNLVTVKPKVMARDLKAAISAALVRSAQLQSKHVGVITDESGGVTLRGSVSSWAEYRQAEHACWAAPGITAVDNQLRISY